MRPHKRISAGEAAAANDARRNNMGAFDGT
jgi:hypothetical protein